MALSPEERHADAELFQKAFGEAKVWPDWDGPFLEHEEDGETVNWWSMSPGYKFLLRIWAFRLDYDEEFCSAAWQVILWEDVFRNGKEMHEAVVAESWDDFLCSESLHSRRNRRAIFKRYSISLRQWLRQHGLAG